MSITIQSSTDTPEQVAAAIGVMKAPETKIDNKPAADASQVETADESGAPETEQEEEEGKEAAAVTEDQDEEDEQDGDEKESKDETPNRGPSKGVKKRFATLTKRATAAEQRAADAEAELARLRGNATAGRPAQEEQVEATTATNDNDEPNPDDFESPREYQKALTKHLIEKNEKTKVVQAKQLEIAQSREKQKSDWISKADVVREKHTDYDAAIESIKDIILPPVLVKELYASENGPELGYALAKNRKELERICALDPLAAVRALGKFEASLAAPQKETTVTKKITTAAPAPITPVGSKGATSTAKSIYDADKLSQKEYEAARRKGKSA